MPNSLSLTFFKPCSVLLLLFTAFASFHKLSPSGTPRKAAGSLYIKVWSATQPYLFL